jgi:hypothetical protein
MLNRDNALGWDAAVFPFPNSSTLNAKAGGHGVKGQAVGVAI